MFPVQSSEFMKLLNFGSNLKKKLQEKKLKNFICHLKINFYRIFFLIWNRLYSDKTELDLSDGTIRIQYFRFTLELWWKNCWKLQKLLLPKKRIILKLSKISIPNFYSKNWRLEWMLWKNFTSLSFILSEK